MNDINPRLGMVITIAIGGLAIAAWKLAVAPMYGDLAASKAQAATLTSQVQQLTQLDIPEQTVIEQELVRLKDQQERLSAASQAPDGNRVQEQLKSLAIAGGVRIDRLERRSTTPAARDLKQTSFVLKDSVGYSLSAFGSYSAIADFARAIRSDIGLTKITSIKLTPVHSGDKSGVTATIETSHMRLIAPQAKQEASAKKGRKK